MYQGRILQPMSDSALLAPNGATKGERDTDTVANPRARTVRRRQPLPSGRAVVGGFLIALAGLVVFLAWAGATEGPTSSYVVAARDLPIGTRLAAEDLRLVPMDLPDSLARTSAFDRTADLEGVRVINPIQAGELVQASSLVISTSAVTEREISFSIEASRAVDGTLKPGEFIDVLATFGAGEGTYTTTVLQGSRVLSINNSRGGLGAADSFTITVAVADGEEARALAHAVNVAKLVLVRSDHNGGKAEQGASYRAPSAASPED